MIGFKRGQEPKDAMGLGASGAVRSWLDDNNTARATHHTKLKDSRVIADVEGNAVLENFDIGNHQFLHKWGLKEVKIGNVTGCITILNQIGRKELISRVINYYNNVLENCLGKTLKEQEEYLFNKVRYTEPENPITLKTGAIKDTEEYIVNFPAIPTKEQILDLANLILSGELQYGCPGNDEYFVQMKQYAETIIKTF